MHWSSGTTVDWEGEPLHLLDLKSYQDQGYDHKRKFVRKFENFIAEAEKRANDTNEQWEAQRLLNESWKPGTAGFPQIPGVE